MLRRLGGMERAPPLAIASLSACWARGLGAHRRQRGGSRELSALQFAERVAERTAPGATARLPRPRARPEHERGPGRRLTGERSALIENEETPVEELADLDATAGVGAPAAAGRDLHPAQAEVHSVVTGDGALVAAAQELSEVARRWAPGRGGGGGRPRKAVGEIDEELGEEGIAGLEGLDVAQPQLTGQAILQRGPQPFDAPFGLGRVGPDKADPEGPEHAAEVRRVLVPLKLFGERPVGIVAGEDIEAVAVELQGEAIRATRAVEDGDIAMEIFVWAEPQGQGRGGGVIDQPMERRRGAAVLEPGEGAGVELGQLAQGRFPGPPAAVLGGAPSALGGSPQGSAEVPHRGATDDELGDLPQLLGQMDVVEASVRRGDERGELRPGLQSQLPIAGAPPQGVEQAAGAALAEAVLQPPK